jgi:enoyl-CoA hydratase
MSPSLLSLEAIGDGVSLLTLRRPERLNALSWELTDEILATLQAVGRDASVRVLVLTGEGRGFCSGLDISGDDPLGEDDAIEQVYARQEKIASLATALRALPQPVIAAVNGAAAGGGLALALASDIRLASDTAKFNVAFVRIGLSGCDVGVSYLLPRIVGLGMASELMLTGRIIDAQEAERIGLANHVVPADGLLDAAITLAGEITRNSPFGVRMTKQVLGRNVDAPSLETAIELENRTQVLTIRTGDGNEAMQAFIEKREPRFGARTEV